MENLTEVRERITRPTQSETRLRRPDINYDLSDLDIPERMWLWRHRQPSWYGTARGRKKGAMSQAEAAQHLMISAAQYKALEHGDTTLLSAEDVVNLRRRTCWDPIEPTATELCFLARKRSKRTVKQIATRLGVSPYLYLKAEEEGDKQVRAFWTREGFEFP
jgi:hypothetical protein